jgi:hypothetical protein
MAFGGVVNIKQFIIAGSFFTLVSLGAIFGLALLFAKLLVPPSGLDAFATNYLGYYGPLIIVVTSFVLATGLVYLLTRKLIVPRFKQKY